MRRTIASGWLAGKQYVQHVGRMTCHQADMMQQKQLCMLAGKPCGRLANKLSDVLAGWQAGM